MSPNANLDACDGTLVPVCGRSIFLAKFAPPTVVLPASGSINVPIGILPFVTWNTSTATCAQPISATLTLTLTCTPVGGSPVVIGPQNFTVPTPTVPGPQFLGGPVNFVIPAGTLPPGTPAICTVAGSYVGNQVAGLPDGVSKDDAFGMDVFAISAIDPGTDTFPAAFAQNLSPGELLHGDPTTPSAQELSDNVAKDSASSALGFGERV